MTITESNFEQHCSAYNMEAEPDLESLIDTVSTDRENGLVCLEYIRSELMNSMKRNIEVYGEDVSLLAPIRNKLHYCEGKIAEIKNERRKSA